MEPPAEHWSSINGAIVHVLDSHDLSFHGSYAAGALTIEVPFDSTVGQLKAFLDGGGAGVALHVAIGVPSDAPLRMTVFFAGGTDAIGGFLTTEVTTTQGTGGVQVGVVGSRALDEATSFVGDGAGFQRIPVLIDEYTVDEDL